MKVLLYTEGYKTISKSGLGKAIKHQMKALEDNNIEYTTNLKDDFDVLHINFYGPKSYLFAKKMRKKGKKIVYHAHSTEEDFRNSFLCSNLVAPLFKKWLCACYRLGDQIITPTEYSKRLLENYNLNRPIKAISNGVDTEFFECDEKAGKSFRRKYGYKAKDKVIVGIGLYIERKGILDFVELAKRLPEYKFIWFGYSPLWASPRKIKKAVTTKLDNLTFAGYVESSVIKSALSGADLYIFPTLEETEGIPIIEALTSKIPTLIRDIPVFEEYEDKKTVYKAKNIDEFEEKIKLILNNELPDLSESGYKLAKKKDTKIVGKELIKTYKETLKMERIKEEKKVNYQYFRNLALILATILFCITMTISSKGFYNIDKLRLGIKETKEYQEYSSSFDAMDTTVTIKLYSDSESNAKRGLKEIEELYKEYDELTDRNNKDSELYKINHNDLDDEYLTIDSRLYDLIKYGLDWYDDSNRILNINTGSLTDIWKKYRDKQDGVPTSDELSDTNIDISKIQLSSDNRIKNNHPNIDLDNIKKGYVTKKAVDMLKLLGIDSYIINAGGNITVGNYYKNSGKYIISISNPNKDSDDMLLTLSLTNKAIASKSLYEKYYEYNGKTYNHIIDSKTKQPANNMVGVTVICNNSDEAEALASTLFLMSVEEGQELVNSTDDVEAIWVYEDEYGETKEVISDDFYSIN